MPKVNWDDEAKADLVTDGEYLCRVFDINLKYTKTGKEMWEVYLMIESEGPFYGKKIKHNLVFGEGSMWVVKQFYEAALGKEMTGEQVCDTEDLRDRYVKVIVQGSKEFSGKLYPVIVAVNSAAHTVVAVNSATHKKSEPEEEIPF